MVRSVDVGEILPTPYHHAERCMVELFAVLDELIDDLAEFVTTTRVRPDPGENGNLGPADVSRQERVPHGGSVMVHQAGLAARRSGLGR